MENSLLLEACRKLGAGPRKRRANYTFREIWVLLLREAAALGKPAPRRMPH